jgi:hypothetical protein
MNRSQRSSLHVPARKQRKIECDVTTLNAPTISYCTRKIVPVRKSMPRHEDVWKSGRTAKGTLNFIAKYR